MSRACIIVALWLLLVKCFSSQSMCVHMAFRERDIFIFLTSLRVQACYKIKTEKEVAPCQIFLGAVDP